ncbi:MAG: hypothetical protein U9N77_05410 [Thermodesulfobacteriota bacterium]|nr:hypothetical protein [Thermodesulfobacteriota bacterium]
MTCVEDSGYCCALFVPYYGFFSYLENIAEEELAGKIVITTTAYECTLFELFSPLSNHGEGRGVRFHGSHFPLLIKKGYTQIN